MAVIQMMKTEDISEDTLSFDDFWLIYPRRAAKKDARIAWEKIPPRLHIGIITALYDWRRIWNARGEVEFIPYPATWLRGERWEDDFPPGYRPYSSTPAATIQEEETPQPKSAMPEHIKAALQVLRAKL